MGGNFHKMESYMSFLVSRSFQAFKSKMKDFKKIFSLRLLQGNAETVPLTSDVLHEYCQIGLNTGFPEQNKAQEMFNLSLLNLVGTYLNRNYRMIIAHVLGKLKLIPVEKINRKHVV